jgi:hypothetical protein
MQSNCQKARFWLRGGGIDAQSCLSGSTKSWRHLGTTSTCRLSGAFDLELATDPGQVGQIPVYDGTQHLINCVMRRQMETSVAMRRFLDTLILCASRFVDVGSISVPRKTSVLQRMAIRGHLSRGNFHVTKGSIISPPQPFAVRTAPPAGKAAEEPSSPGEIG